MTARVHCEHTARQHEQMGWTCPYLAKDTPDQPSVRGVRITIDRDPSYAPCGYLICRVTGEPGRYDWDTRDEENTVLVQTDWDFPGVASNFGFVPCACGATDGTVDCAHKTATQMIAEAADYLDAHAGDVIDDPGYFEDDEL